MKEKKKQAEFHIKQREMYIDNLKAQLAMRDQIIKEKLGASVTNFLKQDLLTLQDIENVSQDVLLPSLKITKSNKFDYNTDNDENYKNNSSDEDVYQGKNKNNRVRRVMGSDRNAYPLPNIKGDNSLYEDLINKGYGKALKNNKSKESLNKGGSVNIN